MIKHYVSAAMCLLSVVTAPMAQAASPNKDEILARYERSRALETFGQTDKFVKNAKIYPNWIGETDSFWYQRSVGEGKEFRLVNAFDASNKPAFDHVRLAKALAKASGETVDKANLPISNLEFDSEKGGFSFAAFEARWVFDGKRTVKKIEDGKAHPYHWLISPDGKKAVFVKDYNLWVHDLETGEEQALSHDGEKYFAYGMQPESRDLVAGIEGPVTKQPPQAMWSPDSSKLFTLQMDERQVRMLPTMLYVPQDGTIAPRVQERKYALPGDKHIAKYRMLVLDVATGKETAAHYPHIEDSFVWEGLFSGTRAWWSGDNRTAYFIDMSRGQKTARVIAFDSDTGATRTLFEESAKTYLDLGPDYERGTALVPLPETDELIWWSERSGWAHLYLYDLKTGKLKNAITEGDWLVREVLYVDAKRREVFIMTGERVKSRNPYYREVARVNMDTGEMTVLASSNHDYIAYHTGWPYFPKTDRAAGISPTGNFVVTTRSRVDDVPVTELFDRQGALVLSVETADISGLPENWQWPEPVKLTAADGKTDIYGVVFKPSDFDPSQKYPVVDFAMGMAGYAFMPVGPFNTGGQLGSHYYMTLASVAELGFIVTVINGRGTPYRSKAFHDYGYASFIDSASTADHVAGIKELAKTRPYMDLSRVGGFSSDGPGQGAVMGLLGYPDFFKAGVANAMFDPRLVRQGEVYMGITTEKKRKGFSSLWHDLAPNLKGKLLLVNGVRDSYFHNSMMWQLVDALYKANKDVDIRLQPNGGHGLRVRNAHRASVDYLVRHLQGVEPPVDFMLRSNFEHDWPQVFPEKISGN